MPLAGVTGRAELLDAVHSGGLGGTFGGNPVACAAALAAIDVYERDDLAGAARVARACAAQGVLVLTCGTWGNVLRLLPPLVIDDELLDDALDVLEAALQADG
jgi:4-aminobutyrate aminotransferase/(S)-3-amino-2-methylpropionate transaminase